MTLHTYRSASTVSPRAGDGSVELVVAELREAEKLQGQGLTLSERAPEHGNLWH